MPSKKRTTASPPSPPSPPGSPRVSSSPPASPPVSPRGSPRALPPSQISSAPTRERAPTTTWRDLDVRGIDLEPREMDKGKPKLYPGSRTAARITYFGKRGLIYQIGSRKNGITALKWQGPKFWDQTQRKFPGIEDCYDFRPYEDGNEHENGIKLILEFPLKEYQSDEPDNFHRKDFEALMAIRDRINEILSSDDRWQDYLPYKMTPDQLVQTTRGPLDYNPNSEYAPTIKATVHMKKCKAEDSVHNKEHLYVDRSEVMDMDGNILGTTAESGENGKRPRNLYNGEDVDALCGTTRNIFAMDFSMIYFKKAEINYVPPIITICSERVSHQRRGAELQ